MVSCRCIRFVVVFGLVVILSCLCPCEAPKKGLTDKHMPEIMAKVCFYCLVLSSLVLSCLVLSCLVLSGLVLSGLVLSLSCLDLSGLVWFGLVWSGLVWSGLV